MTDTQTKKDYPFINDSWLAVESDDGQIERLLAVAGEKELKKFHLVFASTVSQGLLDGHIWFSVFLRPKESSFTRVRRISACLALIFLTMLTNAMFFGAGDVPGNRKILWLGNFKINMTGIIIGIQSSIIVIPPSVIIIEIFRRLRPPNKKKSKLSRRLSEDEENVLTEDDATSLSSQDSATQPSQPKKKKKEPFMFPNWYVITFSSFNEKCLYHITLTLDFIL